MYTISRNSELFASLIRTFQFRLLIKMMSTTNVTGLILQKVQNISLKLQFFHLQAISYHLIYLYNFIQFRDPKNFRSACSRHIRCGFTWQIHFTKTIFRFIVKPGCSKTSKVLHKTHLCSNFDVTLHPGFAIAYLEVNKFFWMTLRLVF